MSEAERRESQDLAKYAAWTDCTDKCDDPGQHDFYVNGGGFVWRWPHLHVYKPADTRPRAEWNRYPHNIIGLAVVLFGRCWGLTWKGLPKRRKSSARLLADRLRLRAGDERRFVRTLLAGKKVPHSGRHSADDDSGTR